MAFFNAEDWKGKHWLIFLCCLFFALVSSYYFAHRVVKGLEYAQPSKTDIQNITNLFSIYDDTATDPVVLYEVRQQRNSALVNYLQAEVHSQLVDSKLQAQKRILLLLNKKDAISYLNNTKFLCIGYFWLTGTQAYWEVTFWSLFGVLTSLIYYISIANRNTLSPDTDTGIYDPSEIPSQVGKMFYAPMCTLVLVLGYSLINKDGEMIDINAGKGLILFSFICGFFSGRVMKFLDKLKELLLPATNSPAPLKKDAPPTSGSNVSVQLQLAPSLVQAPEGPDIVEAGFNSATVTLTGADGKAITLSNPDDDQSDLFTGTNVPAGVYALSATMNFCGDNTIINLGGTQSVTVAAGDNSYTLQLEKKDDEG